MTIPDAAALIRKLLAGVDPDTGEVLPEEHLLHDSSVREALLTALQAMSAQNKTGSVMTTRSGRLNAGRPWTTENLADLRQLYESGMSIDEIARLTHRRARGIRLQLNLMAGGGKRRDERADIPEVIGADSLDAMAPPGSRSGPVNSHQPWPPAQDASLAEMFRAGESIPQLAEAFGRSPHAIVKRLQKLRLLLDEESPDSPTRVWTEKDIAQLRRLHESGLPVLHIAARLNRTEAAINARLFYMGLGGSAPSLFPEDAPPPPPPEDALSADPPLPEKVAAAVSPPAAGRRRRTPTCAAPGPGASRWRRSSAGQAAGTGSSAAASFSWARRITACWAGRPFRRNWPIRGYPGIRRRSRRCTACSRRAAPPRQWPLS